MMDKIDWDIVEKEGRGKILWLEKTKPLHIFTSEKLEINFATLVDLPKNWRVRDVYYEFESRSFGFVIISNEFSKTSIGAKLPDLERDKVKTIIVKGYDIDAKIKKE